MSFMLSYDNTINCMTVEYTLTTEISTIPLQNTYEIEADLPEIVCRWDL